MKKFSKGKMREIYEKLSIQQVISIAFTLVAVFGMLLIGTTLYFRYTKEIEEKVSENNVQVLEQINLNLDNYLRKMMRVSDTVYYRGIKKKDLAKENIDLEMSLLYEENKESLVSICLFSEEGEGIASYPLRDLKKDIGARGSKWFQEAINKKENFHFSTPHIQNLYEYHQNKYNWVVSLSRSVEITRDGQVDQGVLLVDMNFLGIERIFSKNKTSKNSYTYLTNKDGEIIYHPRQQLIYSDLEKENNLKVAEYDDGVHKEKFLNEERITTVKTAGYTGWKIINVTPMKDIISGHREIKVFFAFIIFFTLFLLIIINIFVSQKIAYPIKRLEKSVRRLERDIKDIDIQIQGSSEVKHLGKAIKSMAKQMNILMDNIVVEQEAKRKNELNALQAQINPHFLYNTLDSIIWMVEKENYEDSIIMVGALAKFFRISLSKGKNIITIKNELEHAKNYLTIQKIRYKNKFSYKFKIEEEVKNLGSIKLIVQPLIENAIFHGMEDMDGDGEILIHGYKKENDVYIDVVDNGMGMLDEVRESLLTSYSKEKGKGSGIGLKNVNERIKLYFGEEYGLEIYSELDEGTTVRIHMPCIDIEKIDERELKK
ncbi:sensor histidine kinase [uncultured Clostridium sp.]|uniref:cache domain-containing sensor histidine kinase n=1 Tax=uncultured Clostridium sp. TaxID=59620 RepID=UPI00261F0E39|nr:sensor histidine kinase [uncultured Clostridium sp.]